MTLVRIKPGLSHLIVGKLLGAGEMFDASPAEMESFGDKFILVVDEVEQVAMEAPTPPPSDDPPGATRGAIKLAAEHSLSLALSYITGTGAGGRITKADVQAFLANEAGVELVSVPAEAVPNGDAE